MLYASSHTIVVEISVL